VEVSADQSGLERDSVILTEQIRTIDKSRLKQKVAFLEEEIMEQVDQALAIQPGSGRNMRERYCLNASAGAEGIFLWG
jgi:hypothetical protein